MNIYKKVVGAVIIALGTLAVTSNLSATALSEDINAVNAIAVTDNSNFHLGTVANSAVGTVSSQVLADILTLMVTSNTKIGYNIEVKSDNGFLQETDNNGDKDGDRILYKMSCDAIPDVNGSVTGVNTTTVEISTSYTTIQDLDAPTAARNGGTGNSGNGSVANCDFSFKDGESTEESFSGTYEDTLTFAINAYGTSEA